jgi:hypothetical protein
MTSVCPNPAGRCATLSSTVTISFHSGDYERAQRREVVPSVCVEVEDLRSSAHRNAGAVFVRDQAAKPSASTRRNTFVPPKWKVAKRRHERGHVEQRSRVQVRTAVDPLQIAHHEVLHEHCPVRRSAVDGR